MKVKIRKGLSLNIKGAVGNVSAVPDCSVPGCALVPDDFHGFVPKLSVKEGDTVKVGDAVLFNKLFPDVKLTSPVAGTVKAVVRGDRRKILRVEIEGDGTNEAIAFETAKDSDSARKLLAESGMLTLMRQRPYDIVPDASAAVRDVFITAFDKAPLAVSCATLSDYIFSREDYQAGVDVLTMVTDGKVYFAHDNSWKHGALSGAEDVVVDGPYPASNVGVQIANIAPVNKGETVWTLDVMTLGRIGRLQRTGKVCPDTVVAVAGPEVVEPKLVKTVIGAPVKEILGNNLAADNRHKRIISGNILTGTAVGEDGYLQYPYRQITVIAEGDDVDEFMGWASLSPSKMSESPTFPGHFLKRLFSPDARVQGGRRAMIMSGQLDRYMPMDIIPEYLLKAIISQNIEDMEKLGIYEVAPEDFAAAEYADTSKMPLQQIVRDGLDYLRKELE